MEIIGGARKTGRDMIEVKIGQRWALHAFDQEDYFLKIIQVSGFGGSSTSGKVIWSDPKWNGLYPLNHINNHWTILTDPHIWKFLPGQDEPKELNDI